MRGRPETPAPQPLSERLPLIGLDALLLSLVVFTPLAFGSVEPWAIGVIQVGAALGALLWLLDRLRNPGGRTGQNSPWRAFVEPLRSSGLTWFVVGFIALLVLQLAPLPPRVLSVLSPAAAKLYQRVLPDYSKQKDVDFNHLEEWLLENPREGRLSEAEFPWRSSPQDDLVATSWRTLSLVPANTRRAFGLFLSYLVLALVAMDRGRDSAFRSRLLWAVAFTGALVALLGLAQRTTWGDKLYGSIQPAYGGSPMGPFVNKNHFAGYLELSISVLLGLLISIARRESSRSRASARFSPIDNKYVPQMFMAALLVIMGYLALWRSESRGALVASAVALGTLAVPLVIGRSEIRLRWKVLAVLLMVGGGAALAVKIQSISSDDAVEGEISTEPSLASRIGVWRASAGMFLRFAALGTGFGTYGHVIPLYQGRGYERLWVYAHNEYVQLACETGILGLIMFAGGFWVFFRRALLPVLRRPLSQGGAAIGCGLGIVSLLVHSIIDFNLQIPSNGLLFVLLSSILIAISCPPAVAASRAAAPEEARSSPRPGTIRTATMLALCVGAIVLTGCSVMVRHWQAAGTSKFWSADLQEASTLLQRALRFGRSLPDLQADVGFFYLRALEDWDGSGEKLGIPKTEALRLSRAAFCNAIELNAANTTPWSGLAELYLLTEGERIRKTELDLSDLLGESVKGSTLERLHIAVLRKMMSLEPRNPFHHDRLGDFLWLRGDREAALRIYREAVRLLPKGDSHRFLEGPDVAPELWKAAIEGAQEALRDGSSEVPPHLLHHTLSVFSDMAGDTQSAIEHMERATLLNPGKEFYRLRTAYLVFKQGDLARSKAILLDAMQRGVRAEGLYRYLAMIADKEGEPAKAVQYYRTALSLNPGNGRLALEAARVCEKTGDFRTAERYYEMAQELLPSDVNVLLAASDHYMKRGLLARSVPLLRKVVALRPHEQVYKERLNQVLERTTLGE